MTPEKFNELANKLKKHCFDTLIEKGEQYSRNGDRLHNFKAAARARNCHPIEALHGMNVKHVISIDDISSDVVASGPVPDEKVLLEKIGDNINYLILLYAMLVEIKTGQEVFHDTFDHVPVEE